MAKKKIKDLKDMTSEEILNGMKGVKVTNLKDGDVLVYDGKGNLVNKPKSDLNSGQWRIYIQDTIKLNEELTAENARLLTELEVANDRVSHFKHWNDGYKAEILKLKNDLEIETHFKCNERSMRRDLSEELNSIKSKWWYKLMTWGW